MKGADRKRSRSLERSELGSIDRGDVIVSNDLGDEDTEVQAHTLEEDETKAPQAKSVDADSKAPVKNIILIKLTTQTQNLVGCVVGKNLFVDKTWCLVKKQQILKDIEMYVTESAFFKYKKNIVAYPLDELLIGYVPFGGKPDEFLFCLTEEGRNTVVKKLKTLREEYMEKIMTSKFVIPRPWNSLGSEAEIADLYYHNTRPLMNLEWITKLSSRKTDLPTFTDLDAGSHRMTYNSIHFTGPQPEFIHRMVNDSCTQTHDPKKTKETQTIPEIPTNKSVQCIPETELTEEAKSRSEAFSPKQLDEFMKKYSDFLIKQLHYNEVYDLYQDEYPRLLEQGIDLQVPPPDEYKQYQSFTDVAAIEGKTIVSTSWSTKYTGIVAVAYADEVPNKMKELESDSNDSDYEEEKTDSDRSAGSENSSDEGIEWLEEERKERELDKAKLLPNEDDFAFKKACAKIKQLQLIRAVQDMEIMDMKEKVPTKKRKNTELSKHLDDKRMLMVLRPGTRMPNAVQRRKIKKKMEEAMKKKRKAIRLKRKMKKIENLVRKERRERIMMMRERRIKTMMMSETENWLENHRRMHDIEMMKRKELDSVVKEYHLKMKIKERDHMKKEKADRKKERLKKKFVEERQYLDKIKTMFKKIKLNGGKSINDPEKDIRKGKRNTGRKEQKKGNKDNVLEDKTKLKDTKANGGVGKNGNEEKTRKGKDKRDKKEKKMDRGDKKMKNLKGDKESSKKDKQFHKMTKEMKEVQRKQEEVLIEKIALMNKRQRRIMSKWVHYEIELEKIKIHNLKRRFKKLQGKRWKTVGTIRREMRKTLIVRRNLRMFLNKVMDKRKEWRRLKMRLDTLISMIRILKYKMRTTNVVKDSMTQEKRDKMMEMLQKRLARYLEKTQIVKNKMKKMRKGITKFKMVRKVLKRIKDKMEGMRLRRKKIAMISRIIKSSLEDSFAELKRLEREVWLLNKVKRLKGTKSKLDSKRKASRDKDKKLKIDKEEPKKKQKKNEAKGKGGKAEKKDEKGNKTKEDQADQIKEDKTKSKKEKKFSKSEDEWSDAREEDEERKEKGDVDGKQKREDKEKANKKKDDKSRKGDKDENDSTKGSKKSKKDGDNVAEKKQKRKSDSKKKRLSKNVSSKAIMKKRDMPAKGIKKKSKKKSTEEGKSGSKIKTGKEKIERKQGKFSRERRMDKPEKMTPPLILKDRRFPLKNIKKRYKYIVYRSILTEPDPKKVSRKEAKELADTRTRKTSIFGMSSTPPKKVKKEKKQEFLAPEKKEKKRTDLELGILRKTSRLTDFEVTRSREALRRRIFERGKTKEDVGKYKKVMVPIETTVDDETESLCTIWGENHKWVHDAKLRCAIRRMHIHHRRKRKTYRKIRHLLGPISWPRTRPSPNRVVPKLGDVVKEYYDEIVDVDEVRETEEELPALDPNNPTLIWGFDDDLRPKLRLDSPFELTCLQFCPSNGNLLAGSTKSGQIVLWDLTGRIQAAENPTKLTTEEEKHVKILGDLMDWRKDIRSRRRVPITAMSSRYSSHSDSATSLKWLHPCMRIMPDGTYRQMEPDEPYATQFVTTSKSGSLHIWDIDLSKVKPKQKRAKTVDRPATLDEFISPYQELHNNWKPLFKIRILNLETSNPRPLMGVSFDVAPYVYSRVTPEKTDGSEDTLEDRVEYKYVHSVVPAFNYSCSVGTFGGNVGVITMDLGKRPANSDKVPVTQAWNKLIHDGPITAIYKHPFIPELTLTSGGHVWAIWHSKYTEYPILWKKYRKVRITCCLWSAVRASLFRIARSDGTVEIWDLLRQSHKPQKEIVVSGQIVTAISAPSLPLPRGLLGVGDYNSALRLFYIPWQYQVWTQEELEKMKEIVHREPIRQMALKEWRTWWRNTHETRKKVEVKKVQEIRRKEEEERMRQEEARRKYNEEVYKWYMRRRGKLYMFEEEAEQKLHAKQKSHMFNVIMNMKKIDRKQMEKLVQPLVKIEKHERDREARAKERLKEADELFKQAVIMIFPKAMEEARREEEEESESIFIFEEEVENLVQSKFGQQWDTLKDEILNVIKESDWYPEVLWPDVFAKYSSFREIFNKPRVRRKKSTRWLRKKLLKQLIEEGNRIIQRKPRAELYEIKKRKLREKKLAKLKEMYGELYSPDWDREFHSSHIRERNMLLAGVIPSLATPRTDNLDEEFESFVEEEKSEQKFDDEKEDLEPEEQISEEESVLEVVSSIPFIKRDKSEGIFEEFDIDTELLIEERQSGLLEIQPSPTGKSNLGLHVASQLSMSYFEQQIEIDPTPHPFVPQKVAAQPRPKATKTTQPALTKPVIETDEGEIEVDKIKEHESETGSEKENHVEEPPQDSETLVGPRKTEKEMEKSTLKKDNKETEQTPRKKSEIEKTQPDKMEKETEKSNSDSKHLEGKEQREVETMRESFLSASIPDDDNVSVIQQAFSSIEPEFDQLTLLQEDFIIDDNLAHEDDDIDSRLKEID